MTVDERNSSTENLLAEAGPRADPARTLIGLAARMDDFLDAVGSRLTVILDECDRAAAEKTRLFRRASDFQQERNDWERQRQKDIAQIRSECERLAEAWARLEEADRDRLAGVNGRANQAATQPNDQPVVDASASRAAAMRTADSTVIEESASASRPMQPANEPSPASILMQFQQLKRDIRNHAQRKS